MKTIRNIKLRHLLIFIAIILLFILLVYKLAHMSTFEHKRLKREGDNRAERSINVKAYRGIIVDRNSEPLAISSSVDTIWIDPYYISHDDPNLLEIMNLLSLSEEEKSKISAKVKKREGRSGFVYLKRKVAPYISEKVREIDAEGVNIEREFKRYYPTAEVSSHIVGFTNIDGNGQEGVELKYNNLLKGKDGYFAYDRDLNGGVARKNNDNYIAPKNGENLRLSIDSNMQYLAYKYLKEGILKTKADAGSIVIEDVHTGEILAMANYPSYNPNNMADAFPEKRRNRAITDVFEFGSVMKVFSALAAVQNGHYDADTEINTTPGYYKVGKYFVRDFRDYGKLDLRHILMKSSNVGISRLILGIDDRNILSDILLSLGFGISTGIELPGERDGMVPTPRKWGEFPLATLSFGYGMNATDLQLVSATSTLANKGNFIKPTILYRDPSQVEAIPIISEKNADTVLDMLNSVVEGWGGTGSLAKTELYHVAGKTGTARKITGGKYGANYLASFIGVAPYPNPKIAIAITVDNPKGDKYGGGAVAAPIFSKVVDSVLQVMGIEPNKE